MQISATTDSPAPQSELWSYAWPTLSDTLAYMLPVITFTVAIPALVSLAFWLLPPPKTVGADNALVLEPRRPWADSFRLAAGFSGYAMVLGLFIGTVDKTLAGSVFATVSTLASVYLAYLYGKDAQADARQMVVPSLLSFFLNLVFTMEYSHLFAH